MGDATGELQSQREMRACGTVVDRWKPREVVDLQSTQRSADVTLRTHTASPDLLDRCNLLKIGRTCGGKVTSLQSALLLEEMEHNTLRASPA